MSKGQQKGQLEMGMAASQARLLTITARMHDIEYQAQSIQNAKIELATQSDEVYQDYLKALDATTLTINDGTGQMPLIIFESQIAQMQTNNLDINDFKNKKVNVVGKITEYNNEMEIVLSSGDSLKIIN